MSQKARNNMQTAFNKWFGLDSLITDDKQVKPSKMTADTTHSLQSQHKPGPA